MLLIGKQKVRIPPYFVPKRLNSSGNSKSGKGPGLNNECADPKENVTAVDTGNSTNEVINKEGAGCKISQPNDKHSLVSHPFKKSILVPRVPPTDYIPTGDVQTEGLYAGYRPLFLGNSPVRGDRKSNALDNFFSSFTNLKLVDETKNSKVVNVNDIIEDLKRDNTEEKFLNNNGKNRRPIIPWDASISGMVYNDQPFRDVPKNVVSRLKPFKVVRVEKKSDSRKNPKGTDLIRMKVHNSKVNDESEMINLSNVHRSRKSNHVWHKDHTEAVKEAVMNSRKNYERELSDSAYRHKFIKSDQRVFKSDTEKINRLLAKEFHKQTHLSISSEFTRNLLPLYIYVDKSISARRLFRRFLKKRIVEHTQPVLTTLLASYDTKEQARKFNAKITLKINNIVRELSEYLPSVYFTGKSVDCILHSSPIPGFKRIHWLKPHKRHCIFWGKNVDIDYFFHLNGEYNITRGGVKYMRYPINLHWKTFDGAFSEWDYFAQ